MNITEVKQEQEIWYYKERRILISEKEKVNTMRKKHDDPKSEHPGFKETLKKINQTYYWDQMRKKIDRYVQECQICQQERTFRKTGMKHEIERSPEV